MAHNALPNAKNTGAPCTYLTNNFTVVVLTRTSSNQIIQYTKEVDLATQSKSITFTSGKLTTFSVTVEGRTALNYEPQIADGYYLVRYKDASNDRMLYPSNVSGSSNLDAIVNGFSSSNGVYDATSDSKALWHVSFNSANNTYTFSNEATSKKLYSSSATNIAVDANNYTGYYLQGNEDGTYTILKTGSASGGHLRYNYNSGNNPRFNLSNSGSFNNYDKITLSPAFSTPDVSYSDIELANSNAVGSTSKSAVTYLFAKSLTLEGVYSNPEMTSATDWFDVEVSSEATGALSYTVTANETATARTAYVKLTARGVNNTKSTITFRVFQPEAGGEAVASKWEKVTNAANLSSGDVIIFVNESSGVAMSTTQNNNNRGQESVTISAGEIASVSDNVQQIDLGKSGDNWTFYTGSGYLYAASSSNNYLKTQTTNDANGEWTISIESGNANITAQGTNTRNKLKYNSSSSIFSCYGSGQAAVQIYKLSGLKDPALSFASSSVAKNIGDAAFTNTLTKPAGLNVSYTSSDTEVATVAADGQVTIVGVGSATIVASSVATEEYKAGFAHYDLTVTKKSAGLSYADTAVQKYVDDADFTNTLTNTGFVTVSYASDNTTVATVNPSTGLVDILKPGVANITATFAGNATYDADEASYKLTVIKHDANLAYDTSAVEKYVGDDNFTNELTNPHTLGITYESSVENVATVDENGVVDVLAAGETVITATFVENDNYYSDSVSYTLTVNRRDAELAYADAAVHKYVDDDNFTNTLTNLHNLDITYVSTNEVVATVDENGVVDILAVGTTTIKAQHAQTDEYLADEATYTLTVVKHPAELHFAPEGVNVKAGRPITTPELTNPGNLIVTYSSDNASVASVDEETGAVTIGGAGEATITATAEENGTYYGGNATYSITVARRDIKTMSFANSTVNTTKNADPAAAVPALTIVGEFDELVSADGVTYSSNNESVATVTNGSINALYPGTATITASRAQDNYYNTNQATFTVNVSGQLDAPANVSISSLSKTAISASWGAVLNASGYTWKLYKKGDSNDTLERSGDVNTNSISNVSISISAGTYYLKVLAKGNGASEAPVITNSAESAKSGDKTISDTNYATTYTSTLTMSGATASTVVINETSYDAQKAGTGKAGGSITITVPSGKTKLHLHMAAWSSDSPSVSVAPTANIVKINNVSTTTISPTSDTGISGNGTSYTLTGTTKLSTDYYFIIDLTGITTNTGIRFSTSAKNNRFVIWGVNAE